MSLHFTEFVSQAAELRDDTTGTCAWLVSLHELAILVCVPGETSVLLTRDEQLQPRTEAQWKMKLISRGMISPGADLVANFLHESQQARLTNFQSEAPRIGDGETDKTETIEPDENTKQN